MGVHGYKNFHSHNAWCKKGIKEWPKCRRIASTHNLEIINEHDSFAQHRCYTYSGKCVCECIGDKKFFLDGNTAQGGKNRGAMNGQYIQTKATLKAAGKFWTAPAYWVSKEEVAAIKSCCKEEVGVNPDFILPATSCKEVVKASDSVIRKRVQELENTMTNTKIRNWLESQGCFKQQKTATRSTDYGLLHKHFDRKTAAHNVHVYENPGF